MASTKVKIAVAAVLVVAAGVALFLQQRAKEPVSTESNPTREQTSNAVAANPDLPKTIRPVAPPSPSPSVTPFSAVYSQDLKQFAANLRAILCPEETVKDILMAEVSRRFRTQDETLHPKPADHVPFFWSASTSERNLVDRRRQAAALASEKAALLRNALGYEVAVPNPLYAMTTAELRFEDSLEGLAPDKRVAARQARENYWTAVQTLQARTRGFWQSDDVAELGRLKQEFAQAMQAIFGPQ
jgi:hypothetical protein